MNMLCSSRCSQPCVIEEMDHFNRFGWAKLFDRFENFLIQIRVCQGQDISAFGELDRFFQACRNLERFLGPDHIVGVHDARDDIFSDRA